MQKNKIFLSSPTMNGQEMRFIREAFETNWIAPLGKNVDAFEREVAEYTSAGYAAALSAGTAALHLAVKLCGVQQDDIVFCSDLTFAATVNPVSYEKGRQVFIDSEYQTWNMDPAALEKAFEKYPHAKAVIVANLYGVPARLDEIKAICGRHQVPLIEDAAESLGATYCGTQTGTFGDLGIYSFNGNKIITTSGGGMLVSKDEEKIKKARFWATQSREPALHYQHNEIGYNYRMSNIVAGIGRGQMKTLDEYIRLKTEIYTRYQAAFEDMPEITMNPCLQCSKPNFWISCIYIDPECGVKPAEIIHALAEENIESRPIWKPMHMQPVFAACDFITAQENRSAGEDIFLHGVCLPSDIKMTVEEQDAVINIVKGCCNHEK